MSGSNSEVSDVVGARGAGRLPRVEIALAGALLLASLGLRIFHACWLGLDTDEPQHLHVAWAWAHGLLPYRDFFDNHTPLFHMLCAPIVWLLGDRADLIIIMRLCMLPLTAAAVACVYFIGRAFSKRVGLWSAVWACLFPRFFVYTLSFRTDVLWMLLWLLAVACLVRRRQSAFNSALAGLALGACLAVSLKTSFLISAMVIAGALTVLLTWGRYPWRGALAGLAQRGAALAAGILLIPVPIVLFFYFQGAIGPFYYATVQHNVMPGMQKYYPLARAVYLIPPAIILACVIVLIRRAPKDRPVDVRQIFIALLGAALVAVLALLPLVSFQSLMPVYPILVVLVVAGLERGAQAWGARRRRDAKVSDAESRVTGPTPVGLTGKMPVLRGALPGRLLTGILAAVAVGLLTFIIIRAPRKNETAQDIRLWQDVLKLTDPGQLVMDCKGELVFRPRAYYMVFETITGRRFSQGLLKDDIAQRLIETGTVVASRRTDRMPKAAAAFIKTNYLPVAQLRVAGRFLPPPGEDGVVGFAVKVPGRYDIITPTGRAKGTLRGQEFVGPLELAPGWYRFVPAAGQPQLALIWAQAVERGFQPTWPKPKVSP